MRSYRWRILLVATACTVASLAFSRTISAEDMDMTVHGMWRDSNGEIWCGSTCSEGQRCCRFQPI